MTVGSSAKAVNCRRCRYYYITWEASTPHGCRLMGFKSRNLPSTVVRRSSGQDCQAFRLKPGSASAG
ncbi:MAG: uracil-DNA glycosylase [Candidatus Adiutrix sp.]|nr:uracil-DNA glycosylase [Candidatus Adiutrix sp.]